MFTNTSNSRVLNLAPVNAGRLSSLSSSPSISSGVEYFTTRVRVVKVSDIKPKVNTTYSYSGIVFTKVNNIKELSSSNYPFIVRKSNKVNIETTNSATSSVKSTKVKPNIIIFDPPSSSVLFKYEVRSVTFTAVTDIKGSSNLKYTFVLVKPIVLSIENTAPSISYFPFRYKFVNTLDDLYSKSIIDISSLVFVDEYLKIDICEHKEEEKPIYAKENTPVFFL